MARPASASSSAPSPNLHLFDRYGMIPRLRKLAVGARGNPPTCPRDGGRLSPSLGRSRLSASFANNDLSIPATYCALCSFSSISILDSVSSPPPRAPSSAPSFDWASTYSSGILCCRERPSLRSNHETLEMRRKSAVAPPAEFGRDRLTAARWVELSGEKIMRPCKPSPAGTGTRKPAVKLGPFVSLLISSLRNGRDGLSPAPAALTWPAPACTWAVCCRRR